MPEISEEARKLIDDWIEATGEETDAASRASFIAQRLQDEHGIDVTDLAL